MITFDELVDLIYRGLTESAENYPIRLHNEAYDLDDIWEFTMLPDTGKFTPSKRVDNTVTHFIDINASLVNSDIDTPQNGIISADISIALDLRVPLLDIKDESGNEMLLGEVRNILDTYFAQNKAGTVKGKDGSTYVYGAAYALAVTGVREITPGISDSIGLHISVEYSILQGGAASDNFVLQMDGYTIPYAMFGLSRVSDPEPGIPSDPEKSGLMPGTCGNHMSGTTFGINVTMPYILVDKYGKTLPIYDYIMGDEQNSVYHTVAVTVPSGIDGVGKVTTKTYTYNMIFSEMKPQVEAQRPASLSFSMVEVDLTTPGIYVPWSKWKGIA